MDRVVRLPARSAGKRSLELNSLSVFRSSVKLGNHAENGGSKERKHMRKVLAVAGAVASSAMVAVAQTTGTNTVTLIADNVTNASNVLTPIAIGTSVIFIVWAIVRRIGSKAAK